MGELLATFSIAEIIMFLVLFATALKGVITFWDWAVDRLRKIFNKQTQREADQAEILNKIEEVGKEVSEIKGEICDIKKRINENDKKTEVLIHSDKDDIKAWITERHHYYCYELGRIDDYGLDCMERRFAHYVAEGGNSYVHTLMEDVRRLPKVSAEKLTINK